SRLWYILVCSLSIMLVAGVASRMDVMTICRNSASNCLAAARRATSCWPSLRARRMRTPGELGSEALSWKPAFIAESSDDLQVGAQRAGSLHRLQDADEVHRLGTERIERLDHISKIGAAAHVEQRAAVLGDIDLAGLRDHGLPAGERRRLADLGLGVDGDGEVAVRHRHVLQRDALVHDHRAGTRVDDDLGRLLHRRDLEVLEVAEEGDARAGVARRAHLD